MLKRLAPHRRPIVAGLAAMLAAGAGWMTLDQLTAPPIPEASPASQEAKLSDRLGFGEEDVPVRQARIFDTLAMFSLPEAEPRPWSGRRVPTLAALDAAPAPGRSTGRAAMPRMVAAERAEAKPTQTPPVPATPPQRPVDLAGPSRPAAVASAETGGRAEPSASKEREPISLMGWDVPGTQHLPGRKEAAKTATYLGDKAKRLGSGTVSVVSGAASAVGDTVSSVGSTLAETVGLR